MFASLTTRERTTIWLLAAVGAISRLGLALRDPAHLATRPYIEDAFYALSCARHIALGQGFTVDGVHPTNGVQPLICMLYAPFFAISADRWPGLQLTFIVQAILQVAGTLLIVALVARLTPRTRDQSRKSSAPVCAAALWTVSAQLLIHNTNGLETGLVAVLLLAILLTLTDTLTWTRTVLLGVLSGLLVLARIDTALFVCILCGWLILRTRPIHQSRRNDVGQALVIGVLSLIISLPWWLYSYHTFGSMMPISGQSESAHALAIGTIVSNAWEAMLAIADMALIFFYHQRSAIPDWMNGIWILAAILFWIALTRGVKIGTRLRSAPNIGVLTPLIYFGLAVLGYYTFLFGAPHFLARYLHPLRLLAVILVSIIAPVILAGQKDGRGVLLRQIVAAGLLLSGMAFSIQRYVNNFTTDQISDLYSAGVWARAHNSERVGMEQSGTAGFVADNVVNLDGKVNQDALRARQSGRVGQYIRGGSFTYLADWPELIAPTLESTDGAGVHYEPIDSIGRVIVYQRK
jgi:hypothetical protein